MEEDTEIDDTQLQLVEKLMAEILSILQTIKLGIPQDVFANEETNIKLEIFIELGIKLTCKEKEPIDTFSVLYKILVGIKNKILKKIHKGKS